MIPIFLPTVVHGLGLVYLFGKQGVITGLGWDIGLYGRTGIILSEIIYTFPQSFLMFLIALTMRTAGCMRRRRVWAAAH